MGELILEEYRLFPANGHTPFEELLAGALADVRAKREPWRAEPISNYNPVSLDRDNAALAPFGYRLESFTLDNGAQRMRLYRGKVLMIAELSLYDRFLIIEPDSQADFALIVEEEGRGLWLVRQYSIEPWNIDAGFKVAFAGGKLASHEFEISDKEKTLWVTLDGERVFTLYVPWYPLSVQIESWQDQWVLEVDGSLIVNGENMNLSWGYGEIFAYRLLAEKPFFFFEKAGKIGISYAGQELPVKYDEVIHGECCGGYNNPRFSEHMAWFYARRDGFGIM